MRRAHVLLTNASFPRGAGAPKMSFTLHPGHPMSITAINVRNQFRGKVKEIIEGPVLSEIDVETPSGAIVTSVITTRSVRELKLAIGKDVIALVKATEVSLATL
jgi:molybdopterin-binding protein